VPLPQKLISRLNQFYETGELKLGTELEACLAAISNTPPDGACITVPQYTSQAAAEAVCGTIAGNIFFNSTTNSLTVYDGTMWVELDWTGKCSQIDSNTAQVQVNEINIQQLLQQLTEIVTDFQGHTHDGITSQPLDIKNLITTAPAGEYFFSTGSGIDCGPLVGTVYVAKDGVVVDAAASAINFLGPCVTVAQNGAGVVEVSFPAVETLKSTVTANSAAIASNVTSITNLATQVVTVTNAASSNTLNIQNLNSAFQAHDHSGLNDEMLIQFGHLLSQDGNASNIANNFVPCADGLGGWNFVDKATLGGAGGSTTLANVGSGAALSVASGADYDIKSVTAGCGIAVTSTSTEVDVAVDFAGIPNVGTALDPVADTILVHDASSNTCVKTSIQSFLSSGSANISAGKGIAIDGSGQLSLDLGNISQVSTAEGVDKITDRLVFFNNSTNTCNTVSLSELGVLPSCVVTQPAHGFSVLDSVVIDDTGTWVLGDASVGSTQPGTHIVTEVTDADTFCAQASGVVTLSANHGLDIGCHYFESTTTAGASTDTQTTTVDTWNNSLFQVLSADKLEITAGSRPFLVAEAASDLETTQFFQGATPDVFVVTDPDGRVNRSLLVPTTWAKFDSGGVNATVQGAGFGAATNTPIPFVLTGGTAGTSGTGSIFTVSSFGQYEVSATISTLNQTHVASTYIRAKLVNLTTGDFIRGTRGEGTDILFSTINGSLEINPGDQIQFQLEWAGDNITINGAEEDTHAFIRNLNSNL
jgi:hypothetical protein